MSTRSKVVFGISLLSAVTVIPWVHYVQDQQRIDLHDGPVRDAARREQKYAQVQLNAEQQERAEEYELQKELRNKYSKTQDVSERK